MIINIKSFLIFLIFFIFFNNQLLAINIKVINIQQIIENTNSYQDFLIKFKSQIANNETLLKEKEKIFFDEKLDINSKTLLLNENSLNILIEDYEKRLNLFKLEIKDFNEYVNKNIEFNESILLQNIIKITENLSKLEKIDLIIEEKDYFLANNQIDISQSIIDKINQLNLIFKIIE